jgi:hypothetical protein
MECLDAPKCMNKILHAVDLYVELTGRYAGMWERYKTVLKPEFLNGRSDYSSPSNMTMSVMSKPKD